MKKKNPTDTTLRNTRAANKRLDALEVRIEILETKLRNMKTPKKSGRK